MAKTADSQTDELPPLKMTGLDRLIQITAVSSALIGLIVLAAFLLLLNKDGYGIATARTVDVEKTGQFGDFIGGLVGSLFALSATLLFYLTLTLQRREFRNSLVELRISSNALKATAEHHRDTLRVMNEEKEFSVCMSAINDLWNDWNEMLERENQGRGEWADIRNQWNESYSHGFFFSQGGTQRLYRIGNTEFAPALQDGIIISDLVERMYWIAHAIYSKTLQEDDRRYLAQVARPVEDSLSKRLIPLFQGVALNIDTLLKDARRIQEFSVNRTVLEQHKFTYIVSWQRRLEEASSLLSVH